MPYIFEDLQELLNNRAVTPDLGYFTEALNYVPPDNKPWQSVIKALETEWHPWHWVMHPMPERQPGEPERAKDDNPGFNRSEYTKEDFKKAARMASMLSTTIPDLAHRLSAHFSKPYLESNKAVLEDVLKHRGIEGHVYIDPSLFGGCQAAKKFANKYNINPFYVLKTGENCSCGGDSTCLTFALPTVSLRDSIPVTDELIEQMIQQAEIEGRLDNVQANNLRESQVPPIEKLKAAALAVPSSRPRMYAGTERAHIPTYMEDESFKTARTMEKVADMEKEDPDFLPKQVVRLASTGANIFKIHEAIEKNLGGGKANEVLRRAVALSGKIRVSDLNKNCDLPYFLSDAPITLTKLDSKCHSCAHYRQSFCNKLRRSFDFTLPEVNIPDEEKYKGALAFQESYGGEAFQMPKERGMVLSDTDLPMANSQSEFDPEMMNSSLGEVDLSSIFTGPIEEEE